MVHVTSEVGRLRTVLVHEPGAEVDRMVPSMMEELLFDDILFGDGARVEHRRFRAVLSHLGIEWLDSRDLLIETLEVPEAREWIVNALVENMSGLHVDELREATPESLTSMLIGGVRLHSQQIGFDKDDLFEIPPIPNYCFQRDPQVVLGDGVIFSAMATPARWREAVLARAIFRFHPSFSSTPVLLDPIQPDDDRPPLLGLRRPSFEGGDFLVLSKEVVAVGYSERTNRTGVRQVARALSRQKEGPRWLIVIALPQSRAYMHLDTILTPVDRDACLVFPPVILPGGSQESRVFEIDLRDEELRPVPRDNALAAMKLRGIDPEPISCGGEDRLVQQREQWTDGSNAFALAPGVITLYDRNVRTAEELSGHGFRIVEADDLIERRQSVDLDQPERVCILLPSHELSRARGGPHCLTHPLLRED